MTIVELREKRAKLWATMEGFLDTHRDRKGVLSAEDDAVYANMEKELNDLTNEVRRMERRDAIAAELAKPVSAPITEQRRWYQALYNNTDPVVLPEQACVVSEILEAIYTSAKTGQPYYFCDNE